MLRTHRTAHRTIWIAMALLIPAIMLLGWFARPASRLPEPVEITPSAEAPR